MNIVTEPKLSGKPIVDKTHKRPVRLVRWFIIVGLLLALLVGGLVWFNYFRGQMIAQFFANNKPPPTLVNVATAKSETIPNLLTAVGDLAAVHQVNVTSDVNGRITDILFTAGASVKKGTPLVQLFDGPDQGDLANFKAQQRVAQITLDRAKQLAERQVEPQIATDTRNIRVQATIQNPDKILKPGMFVTTTVVLPDKPPAITVPETSVDYTLYGDSVYLVSEKKEEDGKTGLIVTRTFVQTGKRLDGRAEITKGLKDGDRVVSVGQLKLQSGSPVTISTDPTPPIPAKPPRY
jgi:multidrug efflux pump subunit AcrA (membrane-fusion protein)